MGQAVSVAVARRWAEVPTAVRLLVGLHLVALVWGAVVHLVAATLALTGPLPLVDSAVPAPIGAYYLSLTALDPLAAVLLALRRRVGLGVGAAVLVSDAVVNGYAIYWLGTGVRWAWAGHLVVSLVAVTVVVTWPVVSPWLLRWRSPAPAPARSAPSAPSSRAPAPAPRP